MSMDRQEIEALLPFLVNGTLEGEERTAVENAVAEDPGLASEFAALRAIRGQMQDEVLETSPGELGLARLMRDVEEEAPGPVSSPIDPPANDNVVPIARLRIWQAAAVVVLGLGLGQAALNTPLWEQGPGSVPEAIMEAEPAPSAAPAATSAPLSDAAAETRGFNLAGDGTPNVAAFRVIFASDTTVEELHTILFDAGLEIVAGPSSIGFYDLALIGADDTRANALEVLENAGAAIEALEDLAE